MLSPIPGSKFPQLTSFGGHALAAEARDAFQKAAGVKMADIPTVYEHMFDTPRFVPRDGVSVPEHGGVLSPERIERCGRLLRHLLQLHYGTPPILNRIMRRKRMVMVDVESVPEWDRLSQSAREAIFLSDRAAYDDLRHSFWETVSNITREFARVGLYDQWPHPDAPQRKRLLPLQDFLCQSIGVRDGAFHFRDSQWDPSAVFSGPKYLVASPVYSELSPGLTGQPLSQEHFHAVVHGTRDRGYGLIWWWPVGERAQVNLAALCGQRLKAAIA